MKERNEEYEEVSLHRIFLFIKRNLPFIFLFSLGGLALGLILSVVQVSKNPVRFDYTASYIVEISDDREMSKQAETFLMIVESKKIGDEAAKKANASASAFRVQTLENSIPETYKILVTGNDPEKVVIFTNELVDTSMNLVSDSMEFGDFDIIQTAELDDEPVQISKKVNFGFNGILGFLIGFLIGLAFIFISRIASGKIYEPKELEDILGVKVLGEIPALKREAFHDKFFKVR